MTVLMPASHSLFKICAIALTFILRASSQAPGDEDQSCIMGDFAKDYPANWKVLMDSWSYEDLLDDPSRDGDNPVWDHADFDENNIDSPIIPTNVSVDKFLYSQFSLADASALVFGSGMPLLQG